MSLKINSTQKNMQIGQWSLNSGAQLKKETPIRVI